MNIPDEFPERIIGTETEYNPVFINQEGTELSYPISASLALPEDIRSVGMFLTNGAKFYVWNSIPEYATPECRGITQATHATESGETFVIHAMQAYAEKKGYRVSLHKRNATDAYYESGAVSANTVMDSITSWGFHENYGLTPDTFEATLDHDVIKTILGIRGILVGSGYWRPTSDEPLRVLPAQKLLDVEADTNGSTTINKPLLNRRNEPHAALFSRLHITSGDNTIYPWSTWMNLGIMSLGLRLVETGYAALISSRLPANPFLAAQAIAQHGPDVDIELVDGSHVTPIDIHEIVATCVADLSKEVQLPKEELSALYEWQRAIDDFRRDPELLQDRSEWIARSIWLQKAESKLKNREYLLTKINGFDRMWDNILPKKLKPDSEPKQGIAFLQRHQALFPGYNPEMVEQFKHTAPEGTRATERAQLIGQLPVDCSTSVDWERVGATYLPDPRGNNKKASPRELANSSAKQVANEIGSSHGDGTADDDSQDGFLA